MFFENWQYWLGSLLAVSYLVFVIRAYREIYRASAGDGWISKLVLFIMVLLLCWTRLVLDLYKNLRWSKSKRWIPFVRGYYLRKEEERTQRINAWKKDHPLVLCYNEMNGVLAVMTEAEYLEAKNYTQRAVMDGNWPQDAKVLCPARGTYIFCHTSVFKNDQ